MISQITFGCTWVNDTDQAIDFATYDQLKARGVEFSAPPTMPPWGEYRTTFVDQDGNGCGLGSPA